MHVPRDWDNFGLESSTFEYWDLDFTDTHCLGITFLLFCLFTQKYGSRLYLDLNMNDFGKIVNFNGIFYHPYFCVNKQNIKNMNPRQCASVKSRSQYSNAPRLRSKIIPVTVVSCLEHAHFLGNCDFEQQFIPSLFAHDIGECAWYGSEFLCVEHYKIWTF